MESVNPFEKMITDDGVIFIKFYFSISKEVQAKRLEDLKSDPLRFWKHGKLDHYAQSLWEEYTEYKSKCSKKRTLSTRHGRLSTRTINTMLDLRQFDMYYSTFPSVKRSRSRTRTSFKLSTVFCFATKLHLGTKKLSLSSAKHKIHCCFLLFTLSVGSPLDNLQHLMCQFSSWTIMT